MLFAPLRAAYSPCTPKDSPAVMKQNNLFPILDIWYATWNTVLFSHVIYFEFLRIIFPAPCCVCPAWFFAWSLALPLWKAKWEFAIWNFGFLGAGCLPQSTLDNTKGTDNDLIYCGISSPSFIMLGPWSFSRDQPKSWSCIVLYHLEPWARNPPSWLNAWAVLWDRLISNSRSVLSILS